ncbi:MAG: hypothetical protein HZB43_12195 [candidate division Zixibacteria bacterium]|nr:hypothetical protein [candidate division Zixibacteria bacterium]
MNDSTDNLIAAGQISSNNSTAWNDPTIYCGDIFGVRGHILVTIKDTLKFKSMFNHCRLDSARLSIVFTGISGGPGSLNCHFIKRHANGRGVYGAYDDSWSYYCRSSWRNRKGATVYSCPDSIMWQTPGATGAADYNAVPFATIASPVPSTRYHIDVTPWIAGVVAGTDSVSNGIMLLASNEDGSDADFFAIANIWPFYNSAKAMALEIWISNWDWVKVRLDSNRVRDGWITADDPDTLISSTSYLNVGTGAASPLQKLVGMIFPQDSALFGPDAIPAGSTIDSARLWLYLKNTFTAPNDTIAAGELLTEAAFAPGHFPSWDSAAPGVDWSAGNWSASDIIRRQSRYVNSVNAWYSWSGSGLAQMLQRWLDSASTRHGLAIWDLGPNANKSSAWADRTAMTYGAQAGSLLVWITPPPIRPPRRAWLDNPDPLK